MSNRSSGILLHITSLPGKEGIGTLGANACNWIDFLHETGQRIWQILPLGPAGYGNSPYMCFSAFAGNPLMIDLFLLKDDNLLSENDLSSIPKFDIRRVDFQRVEKWKSKLLKKAFLNFAKETHFISPDYLKFLDENSWWLDDYALFIAAKLHYGGIIWQGWPEDLKMRNKEAMAQTAEKLINEIDFQKFLQYCFFTQWKKLCDYAHSKNISIIGDMPLYVGSDSADVWANPEIFMLNEHHYPTHVGGVPPDYFSETGQLWGNPVYNWPALKEQDYHWWLARIHFNLSMFDLVRVDHFRGLESFWAVPADEKTAVNGEWFPADGWKVLSILKKQIGTMPLIAEDLGEITPAVDSLRIDFDLPGMRILQFAFSSDETNVHLPHNYDNNTVAYTGTHDNDTLWAWLHFSAGKEEKKRVLSFTKLYPRKTVWALIEIVWASTARRAVIPLQDLLELGAESRMNIPGIANGNWEWRFRWNQIRGKHRRFLKEISERYNRMKN